MPDVGGGEPNIAILPDGTLFVASPAGNSKANLHEGGAYLWRSTDMGATWTTLRQPYAADQQPREIPAGAFCSCDSDVTTSADGWTYYVDWWIAGFFGPGNYLVEASADGGNTWTANSVPIPQNIAAGMDREWVVAGDGGFVGLFYSFFSPTPEGSLPVPAFGLDRQGQAIEAVFSTDHGASWSDPVSVVAASDTSYQIAHPFMAPNGTIMMPYGAVHSSGNGATFWYDASDVMLTWSTDQGKTWQSKKVGDAPLGFDNLWAVQGAVDAYTGEVTVVWAARTDGVDGDKVGKDSHLGLWVTQLGPTGDVPPTLVRGDGQNFLPWATARNGTTVLGWYGGDATGDMMKAAAGSDWFAQVAIAPDGLFTQGKYTVSNVDASPVKSGPICPKGAACGGDRELLDYVSMVLDAQGHIHYTFTTSENGNPHVQVASEAVAAAA